MSENVGVVDCVAVLKEVKAKALVSLDKSSRVMIETEDSGVMELGKWPADETVSVHIERNAK